MNKHQENLEVINFSTFDESQLRRSFGLRAEVECDSYFEDWKKAADQVEITAEEHKVLQRLLKKLRRYVRGWNEIELREKFIAQMLELIDFDDYDLNVASFSERHLEAEYSGYLLKGKVDWMVSSGQFSPERPFFFLHEFKKEQNSKNDPVGQLVAAMFIAKIHNEAEGKFNLFSLSPKDYGDIPMYGLYIIGRLWFFVRLIDTKYCISKAYDSTDETDLLEIYRYLKAQREMIFEVMRKAA